ncbi:MAG TPA: T3SS effector HopA1 family protein [Solirubrobacteraceae bacterium]|nr:T3SS effector HopA1 family protein [Solirubrobacteraceae bacterium]
MSYEGQVLDALGAIGVRAPGAYLWFGRRFEAGAGEPLTDVVAQRLRVDFLEPGAARPARREPRAAGADAASFAGALSHANCGRGSWQPGWRVAGIEEEEVAVVRPDGLVLRAAPADCRVEGTLADVRMPKDLVGASPGVIEVLGDTAPAPGCTERARLSWNITAIGAVTLVARLTYALNQAAIPFTLEVLDEPARYAGRPGAHLLLARSDVAAVRAMLKPLLRALGAHLSDGAPAFSKPLSRGLALVEEPGGGETFGAHRCRLLAEAIIAAGDAVDARLVAVHERFADAQISLDAPYLQPGSIDAYDGS